ncbi:hypothetical protein CY35_01G085500 [Sphagnum magellanicum]|jgi:anterior pharynx defective protein 1|nr:hypothetical protein CY35_01G085500 [Sphagnum magellanicum]
MTGAGGIGYALIALGPAFSLFVTVIASKPFLILTVLGSAMMWLVSLIACGLLWRAFLPGAVWVFFPLLITVVGIQEAVRIYYWHLYLKIEDFLNKLATKVSKPQLVATDKIQIAIASGLGHGIAHSVFFCLSLLTPAFGPATYYVDSCVRMPLFLVAAFTALGFLLLHTFSMVIAFNALAGDKRSHQLFVPVMHLCAALLTLVNLLPGGCIAGVPLTLMCAVVTMAVAGKIVWDKTGSGSGDLNSLHRVHSASRL